MMAGLLCAIPLASEAQEHASTVLTKDDIQRFVALGRSKEAAEADVIAKMSKAAVLSALNSSLSDKTKIIFQQGYGVFIEYTAADGRDRMWFPGNTVAVIGRWGVRDGWTGPHACFKYSNSSADVSPGFSFIDCVNTAQTLSGAVVIDEKSGDVFDLLSGRIPYVKGGFEVPAWPASAPTENGVSSQPR